MKRQILTIALGLQTCLFPIQAEWALIKLLRGDAKPETGYHRVAFVGSAELRSCTGEVEKLSGVDTWSPLRAGATLSSGEVIRVVSGRAVLQMDASGSLVNIAPNTIVRLAQAESGWDRGVLTGQEERSGFVVRGCRGDAYVSHPEGWKAIAVNTVLPHDAQVRTGPGTILDLFCTTQKRALRLQGNQYLDLASIRFAPNAPSPLVALSRK
jgi:hypothetical protein